MTSTSRRAISAIVIVAALAATFSASASAFTIAPVSVNESAGSAIFTVTSPTPCGPTGCTIDYETQDDTAIGGFDYTDEAGTVTIPSGATTATFSVPIIDDTVYEGHETLRFDVVLYDPSDPDIVLASTHGSIVDDDPAPTLSVADVTAAEPATGAADAVFTVTLTGETGVDATATFSAGSGGSAEAGSDYTPTRGTLTFEPGDTTATVAVPILADAVYDPGEYFTFRLSSLHGASAGQTSARAEIVDTTGPPQVNVRPATVTENGIVTVPVELSGPTTALPVSVAWAAVPGTATAKDFRPVSGSPIRFAPGARTATISVKTIFDHLRERAETFDIVLSRPTNAVIATGQARVTIVDDPPAAATVRIPRQSLRSVLSRGLAITTRADEPVTRSILLTVDRATARKLKLGKRTTPIGFTETKSRRAGSLRVVVKVRATLRSRLRRARSLPARAEITLRDATGHVTRISKRVTLR